jgi:hypothetical protein
MPVTLQNVPDGHVVQTVGKVVETSRTSTCKSLDFKFFRKHPRATKQRGIKRSRCIPVEPCVEPNEPVEHATAVACPPLGQADPAGHTRGKASSTLLEAGQ